MSATDRLSTALRVLIAGALFVRLAGVGSGWLPSAPVLAFLLLGWLGISAVRKVDVRGWCRRAGIDSFVLALLAIALLTVAVRLPSIATDLGRQPLDIDEHRLSASLKHFFLTGGIDHVTVEHYPGGVFWAMTAASLFAYLRGLMTGAFLSIQAMPVESFTLAGRLTNVAGAAVTVWLTGLLARRLGGRAAGLISAGLVAVVPLAVDVSTDMRNDPGQVLLLVAVVWAALVAYDTGSPRWATASGVLAGLATGVKYTSVFALVPALVAVAAPGRTGSIPRRIGFVVAGFALALGISNHFLWWDFANFVRQLSDQVAITGPGHWAATANPAAMHRDVLARSGPGWPLLVLAASWGAWVLATGRPRAWLFWSFPLLYSWFTTHRPSQFERWVYPLLPFVAVAGACGLVALVASISTWRGWTRVPRARLARASLTALLVTAAVVPPIRAGAITISRRTTPSTALVLEAWLQRVIPAGDVVLLEQGWLDLRAVRFGVMRVPDLEWALAPGRYALSAADWVVVPEPHYGDPALARMKLMQQVTADQRSFLGNLGYDYRVYVTPRLAPIDAIDVRLDDGAAASMLGWEWGRDPRQPGVILPDRGASLFVPPLARDDASLAIDVANAGSAQEPPLAVIVNGHEIAVAEVASPEPGVRRFEGHVRVPRSPRAIEIRLDPHRHGARMRVLGLRVS